MWSVLRILSKKKYPKYACINFFAIYPHQAQCGLGWGHFEVIKVLICPSIKNLPHLILHEAIWRGQNKEGFCASASDASFFHESHLDIYVVTKKAYCATNEISSWPAEAERVIHKTRRGFGRILAFFPRQIAVPVFYTINNCL